MALRLRSQDAGADPKAISFAVAAMSASPRDGGTPPLQVNASGDLVVQAEGGEVVLSKMTTDGLSHWPVWSPDGTQLVYRSGPMMAWRMWRVPADRSHAAEQLPGTEISQNAESWSPDGHAIAYTAITSEAGAHIMVESLEGGRESRPFVDVKAPAGSPKLSPDGHWLAYCSNESGKAQVALSLSFLGSLMSHTPGGHLPRHPFLWLVCPAWGLLLNSIYCCWQRIATIHNVNQLLLRQVSALSLDFHMQYLEVISKPCTKD